ncbi:MAG: OmpA family protein [Pseudomonadota bacterium]
MKTLTKFPLLLAVLSVTACGQAGLSGQYLQYGDSAERNQFTQVAYKDPSDRLRNLAIDFAAETQDTVTFAFDRAGLDASARKALKTQAKWLKEHPGVRMTIIGHTDLVGSERYNDGLGLRRARAALNYLVRQGVKRSRLEAIESKGESEPVVQTEDKERRNRRAITTVAGFERTFVGDGLDGEVAQRTYDAYQTGRTDVSEADSTETDG